MCCPLQHLCIVNYEKSNELSVKDNGNNKRLNELSVEKFSPICIDLFYELNFMTGE